MNIPATLKRDRLRTLVPTFSPLQVEEPAANIFIDMTAHSWDISAVAAFDKIVARLRREGKTVEIVGYNRASADIVDRFALHDKTGVELGAVPH